MYRFVVWDVLNVYGEEVGLHIPYCVPNPQLGGE